MTETGEKSPLGPMIFLIVWLMGMGLYGAAMVYESGVHRGRCIELCQPERLETTTADGCLCANAVKPLREKP